MGGGMYGDIEFLSVGLPEDITKKKWCGDFSGADRLIARYLAGSIPTALRRRLELERQIMHMLRAEYPHTYRQALAMLQGRIPDFTEAEFHRLEECGELDWIYVDGSKHYFQGFLDTLLSVDADFAARAGVHKQNRRKQALGKMDPQRRQQARQADDAAAAREAKKTALLTDTIHYLKEKKSLSLHYHMRASLRIHEDKFVPGRVLVHLPIPKNCEQFSGIRIVRAEPETCAVDGEDALQRTVSFCAELKENRTFLVEYEFDTRVCYVEPRAEIVARALQPALVHNTQGRLALTFRKIPGCPGAMSEKEARTYLVYGNSAPLVVQDLTEQLPHIRFTPFLRSVAAEAAGDEINPYLLAKRVYDYVTSKVAYAYVRSYLTIESIPEYAALCGRGDCGVQALLFITLCRILGIPARWQSGLNATPYRVSSHDWAQFYVAPYGWLFADCSFGGSGYRNGDIEKHEFYFGNLDPFRMVANSEFQKDFYPPKKHLRYDPFDNQSGEAEYEDRGLSMDDFDRGREVLAIREVEG